MLVEWLHKGKPTALGLASGLVAGLVAVTPASGFVTPLSALYIGLAAGVICYVVVCLKPFFKYDDSLDAFGVHGVGGFLGAVLTGVFASAVLFKAGSGQDISSKLLLPDTYNRLGQVLVQLKAAGISVAYSFLVTLILVKVIDLVFGFTLDSKSEGEGLDNTQHGEVGFDLGLALETIDPELAAHEPRAALVPPNGQKRFTVVVDGADNGQLMKAWSEMCQVGPKPPPPQFRAVYPFMTTVSGNRFRFRGGDPKQLTENLRSLFQDKLERSAIQAYVEK
jgi:hypothetical protein